MPLRTQFSYRPSAPRRLHTLRLALSLALPALLAAVGACVAVAADPKPQQVSTKPTPAEKSKTLKPLPYLIGGEPTWWSYRSEFEARGIEPAKLMAVADGIVTLREGKKDWDVVIAELEPIHRASIERIARLLAKKELGDERALLGSWGMLPPSEGTSETAFATAKKTVINGCEMQLSGGPPGHYSLDASKTPHVIESDWFKGIYELKGDRLRICFSYENDAPLPTEFKASPTHELVVFRRLPDVMTLPLPPADRYDPALRTTIEEFLKLWEAEKYEAALQLVMTPEQFKSIPPEKLAEIKQDFGPQKARTQYMLSALLRVAPKISADGQTAEFDLSQVHADYFGVPTVPITMRKHDGRWIPFP